MIFVAFMAAMLASSAMRIAFQAKNEARYFKAELDSPRKELRRKGPITDQAAGPARVFSPVP